MKKTALQWFIEQLVFDESMSEEIIKPITKALEMEKQQIKDACMKWYDGINDNAGEQYYNETFKTE
jgi:hypothetical protein